MPATVLSECRDRKYVSLQWKPIQNRIGSKHGVHMGTERSVPVEVLPRTPASFRQKRFLSTNTLFDVTAVPKSPVDVVAGHCMKAAEKDAILVGETPATHFTQIPHGLQQKTASQQRAGQCKT